MLNKYCITMVDNIIIILINLHFKKKLTNIILFMSPLIIFNKSDLVN